ncbi:MAG: prepilin-type N-terminal cleavage/methylation domain-containing protein [Negativicutes bacterium]|nr:prepilin-type N-terminal cleavage/methylation domain-containing protein [Negativicutes bacterium]
MNRISHLLNSRRGFTLIEMIVVVAILAILATIAYPKVAEYVNQSRQSKILSDLSAINTAIEMAKVAGTADPGVKEATAQMASGWPSPPSSDVTFGSITIKGGTAYSVSGGQAVIGDYTIAKLKEAANL